MTDSIERRVAAYVDLEAVREQLSAANANSAKLVSQVASLAKSLGRVSSIIAYGDIDHDTARELRRFGCDARLTVEDGEGSVPESIAIAFDIALAMGTNQEADSLVLVTDDAQLGEVVRRIRRSGRYVVAVVPSSLSDQEPANTADRQVSVESLLAGEISLEPAPTWGSAARGSSRRSAAPFQAAPLNLDTYDWTRFVVLLRDLEERMPFVGMRWLKNKVIGPHNVGVSSVADKQLLLNRAVDDGLVETYRVGNREEGGEPVTACRLIREHPVVKEILAANPAAPSASGRESGTESSESEVTQETVEA